ncbi:hypothetical protein TSAR_001338 [Trichomalopsis sarcophagae]|uniref:Pickpocket protein 28 n=1 Tax=Trichomalopsis sarcophagae TaxID=543379 RepID=A0A232F5U6_9HYME|nr:hypothetical protein TSAR_001338 [Trichomalopsis sarcophagae]
MEKVKYVERTKKEGSLFITLKNPNHLMASPSSTTLRQTLQSFHNDPPLGSSLEFLRCSVQIASLITRSTQTPSFPTSTAKTVRMFYAKELLEQPKKKTLDLGLLESPWPPVVGMDRMRARTWWGRFLVEFASKASFHGLNHLAAPRRHACERFLVGLSILGALGGLIAISLDSWHRYQHESTMLVLDNNFRKFEIAKPSITICPINYLDEEKFPEVFRRHNLSDTPTTRSFLLTLANLTYDNMRESLDGEFEAVQPDMWLRLLYELRADVELVSQYADEFTWVSTERGLCLMLASAVGDYSAIEYWLTGKLPIASKTKSRRRSYFNVNNYGVVGSISCKSHDFWASSDISFSATAAQLLGMHYPDTLIEYTTPGKVIRKVTLNSLTLGIAEVGSSERVRRLTVRQRNCKLQEDGGLKMWPVYTSSMCRLECKFEEMRRRCGCYPHFAKPSKFIKSSKLESVAICTSRQLKSCIAERTKDLIHLKAEKLKSCDCLQDCNEALYIDKESTSFALRYSLFAFQIDYGSKEGSPPDAIMNLNIDFPQVKYIHEELFEFTDFLASMGGAAGLFLGASVLSFCEIIYFASLRLLWFGVDEKLKRRKMKRLLRTK